VPNRLASETSPYLLQHAENPVDWYPWGEEALNRARTEDKPILVSIGYSACHWCHVMAHESFEDPDIAAKMNDLFVNIKVDREERPDLDAVYMTAVQAMTGHGGWPLNVFLTPDGTPFYGGTYFPPEDRAGMPGFPQVLDAVADAFQERRTDVEENAEQTRELLQRLSHDWPRSEGLSSALLTRAAEALTASFDSRNGGFGSAPKFPQPSVIEFLLRQSKRGDQHAETMVRRTLDRMASGGIYDQVGGGFHRYAVDAIWLVPHFEKMLYDNSQLASAFLAGYQAYGDERYRRVAEETLDFVVRELTHPDGGFYATLDADSAGHEGLYYTWTSDELDEVLGEEDAQIARAWFAVTPGGNFEGRSVLSTPRTLADVADRLSVDEATLQEAIGRIRSSLLAAREQRERPGLDRKIIASWNGLMLKAFADGARILRRKDFLDVAEKNAGFIQDEMRRDGRLVRSWKDGDARVDGYLEDYAFVIDGLLALYRATIEARWLEMALELTDIMIAEFADAEGPGFFDSAAAHETPVARSRDLHDGATPSGNAVAADVLLRLAVMTGVESYNERASRLLEVMSRTMREQPLAAGRFLAAADFYFGPAKEVALAGDRQLAELDSLLNATYAGYEPNLVVGYIDPDRHDITARLPFLQDRPAKDGRATAYVCEAFACLAPVHDADALVRQIAEGTGIVWKDF
jgi:hypothetical protein